METPTPPRLSDSDRILTILTLLDHVWKINPSWTFGMLCENAIVPDGRALGDLTDDTVEATLRAYLRRVMSGHRDET